MTSQDQFNDSIQPQILSVSALNRKIKQLLEEKYPIIWIQGEISNLNIPTSGHAYFVLKDEKSQISAVFFKGQRQQLKFNLEDGLSIVGMGRVAVYEPRGNYQIILEYAHPHGLGALQLAFEQLKQKLQDEGLFDPEKKASLPFLPGRIGLITSPTGAVVHDMLKTLYHKFPNLAVEIYPVRVQGKEAATDISRAISLANQRMTSDVLILARGGGGLEDLAAYNSEAVARAIYSSQIPLVSAIGHETDYTIADFVADLRAPTPTAAAQIVVPIKHELASQIHQYQQQAFKALSKKASSYRSDLVHLKRSLVHPQKKIQELQLRSDDLVDRLHRAWQMSIASKRAGLNHSNYRLMRQLPMQAVQTIRSQVDRLALKLYQAIKTRTDGTKDRVAHMQSLLLALNPKALLQKGYSITRTIPKHAVVTSTDQVAHEQQLEILLSKGRLHVRVENRLTSSEDDV